MSGWQKEIETTSIAQKSRSPQGYRCPYCWGSLWVEYVGNARYLVKCTREKDRIQYVRATDPYKALEKCAMMVRPSDEWHEDHGPALWFTSGAPEGEPIYVGDPRDDDWDEEYTHWVQIPGWSDYKEVVE